MDDFITELITSINTEGLWSTIGDCVPLIAITVLFGLGFFVICKVIYNCLPGRRY